MDQTTFHAGEQAVQRRLGVLDEIGPWARQVVRSYLPEQHRLFYRELPFIVAAARDSLARPWATILASRPGFVESPDAETLEIRALPTPGDALEKAMTEGSDVGLLGIEPATRRRNRVNGSISSVNDEGVRLHVSQAFGNCPQHIRERSWRWVGTDLVAPAPVRRSTVLGESMRTRIASADTFFIATGHRGGGKAPSYGMDASHRGGTPGFVRVEGDRRLVFPDYAGNNHFNTIGNILMDDRVGLLFVDFETGGLLQLTGRARIDWDSPAVARHPGARRLVVFELDEAVDLPAALPIRWGSGGDSIRTLRLLEKRRESADVTSFRFQARDAAALPAFEGGQHLPVELTIPGEPGRVRRTYSLSNRPSTDEYRISVKREPFGRASRFLHDEIEEGAYVEARAPAGSFVLEEGTRPIALVSAGIGITPTLSMLHELVDRADPRRVVMVRVARDGAHDPHAAEIEALAAASSRVQSRVFYSRPRQSDVEGRDYHEAGRLDARRLAKLLPSTDVEIYLCGPVGFMAELQLGLGDLGVPTDRIHNESFGPAA